MAQPESSVFTVSGEVVLYAIRYGLGRHTYAEQDALDLARRHYRRMTKDLRDVVREDFRRHVQDMASEDFPRALHGPCGAGDMLAEFDRFEAARHTDRKQKEDGTSRAGHD
jgi:hypothetical protein